MPNSFFFNVLSWMLLTDPQIYKMLHGGHHMNVNSWDDRELHPLGKISNPILRKIYNYFEVILGTVFLVAVSSLAIPFNSKYKGKYHFSSLAISIFA